MQIKNGEMLSFNVSQLNKKKYITSDGYVTPLGRTALLSKSNEQIELGKFQHDFLDNKDPFESKGYLTAEQIQKAFENTVSLPEAQQVVQHYFGNNNDIDEIERLWLRKHPAIELYYDDEDTRNAMKEAAIEFDRKVLSSKDIDLIKPVDAKEPEPDNDELPVKIKKAEQLAQKLLITA